jgi:CAAX prenyl protease-like protein
MSFDSFFDSRPWLRYTLPLATFLLLTELQQRYSGQEIFWFYGAKIGVTALVLYGCLQGKAELFAGPVGFAAVGYGLFALLAWIVLGQIIPGDQAVSFDPTVLDAGGMRLAGIALRIMGAVLLVPIVEEIFWRGFLMRYLINDQFEKVEIGSYSALSFIGTIICFMLVHRTFEWPGAVVVGAVYGFLVLRQKGLRGVIVAHGVTNLGLAIYVLITGEYWWW